MVLPRCFLQPCWHTCSLRAAPWVRQGPRRAPPSPGLARGPFSCPRSAQPATVPAPQPALCPLCLRLPSLALSLSSRTLSLSRLWSVSQSQYQSCGSQPVPPCLGLSGLSFSPLISVPALCPLLAFPRAACPSAQPRAPGGRPVPCRGQPCSCPRAGPSPGSSDPGAQSPRRQKGSWEGMRAGVGTAPELPAAMGEVPLV